MAGTAVVADPDAGLGGERGSGESSLARRIGGLRKPSLGRSLLVKLRHKRLVAAVDRGPARKGMRDAFGMGKPTWRLLSTSWTV